MLTALIPTAVLSLALSIAGLLIPEMARAEQSSPSLIQLDSPVQINSAVDDSLVCYMQTANGETLNLNSLCGSNAHRSNRGAIVSQSADPGRLPPGLIRYSGNSNGVVCVVLDQQGRPCQADQ